MLDALGASIGRRCRVLDLGSGPGSLSVRILRRFPEGRVAALDYDPVVRAIGEGALGDEGGRLEWIDVKLGRPGWESVLRGRHYDAAVSTTALHWLTRPELRRLYLGLGRVVRRGGVFLNGDRMPWGRRERELAALGEKVRKVRAPVRKSRGSWNAWDRWWRDARRVPELREAFRDHDRRSASHPEHGELTIDDHLAGLRAAGFATVGVIWQDFDNRVLYARR